MTALFDRQAQDRFAQQVRLITAAGVALPADVAALQQRLNDFQRLGGTHFKDRLVAALVDDDTADLPLLVALAMAEASPTRVDVFDAVRADVNRKIRWVYGSHASDIYAQLASKFDTLAGQFTAAVGEFNPELPAEVAVSATDTQRAAWKAALTLAAQLESMLPALQAAMVLAGVDTAGRQTNPDGTPARAGDNTGDARDLLLPLAVDTTGLHRRRVWAAWDVEERAAKVQAQADQGFTVNVPPPTRTGRWGALVKIGATLRACPLNDFEPYRRPRQLEQRIETTPGGTRRIMVDPEDADYRPLSPALSHSATR